MAVDTATGDIVTARLEFFDGESVGYNLLHYRIQTITDNATGLPAAVTVPWLNWAAVWAETLYTNVLNPWSALASEAVTFTGVTVQDIRPEPRSTPITFSPANPGTGNVAGDPMPLQDTPTFLKRTPFGERWGIGRFFFCGISEESQIKGRLMPAWLANAPAFASVLQASVGANNGTYTIELAPVITHKEADETFTFSFITSVQLSNNVIKTQRRRRPGKGI